MRVPHTQFYEVLGDGTQGSVYVTQTHYQPTYIPSPAFKITKGPGMPGPTNWLSGHMGKELEDLWPCRGGVLVTLRNTVNRSLSLSLKDCRGDPHTAGRPPGNVGEAEIMNEHLYNKVSYFMWTKSRIHVPRVRSRGPSMVNTRDSACPL